MSATPMGDWLNELAGWAEALNGTIPERFPASRIQTQAERRNDHLDGVAAAVRERLDKLREALASVQEEVDQLEELDGHLDSLALALEELAGLGAEYPELDRDEKEGHRDRAADTADTIRDEAESAANLMVDEPTPIEQWAADAPEATP